MYLSAKLPSNCASANVPTNKKFKIPVGLRAIVLLAVLSVISSLYAYDEIVDYQGIRYGVWFGGSCCVIENNSVSGDVIIPSEIPVEYGGHKFQCKVVDIKGGAFKDCKDLTSIIIPNTVITIGRGAMGARPNEDGNWIGTLYIEDGAFEGCTSLKSVKIPNSVECIGKKTFMDCYALEYVEIPNSVISIGPKAFLGCRSLTAITLGTQIEGIYEDAFSGCWKLKEIDIPPSVEVIGGSCFRDCYNLQTINLPEGLTALGEWAFYNCIQLQSIYLPSSLKTEIGAFGFCECSKLEEINVGDGNINYASVDGVLFNKELTELLLYPQAKSDHYIVPETVTIIGYCAFYNNSELIEIEMPESLIEINDNAFSNCQNLTHIDLPDSVKVIGDYAFNGCWELRTVKIPASIEKFGERIFDHCSSIKKVYYYAENPIGADEYMFVEEVYDNAILYVPPCSVDIMKNLYPWKLFKWAENSGLSEVRDDAEISFDFYSLDGIHVFRTSRGNLSPGVYIMRGNGKNQKIKIN